MTVTFVQHDATLPWATATAARASRASSSTPSRRGSRAFRLLRGPPRSRRQQPFRLTEASHEGGSNSRRACLAARLLEGLSADRVADSVLRLPGQDRAVSLPRQGD